MVVVSYSGKEINAKLVYYGPGLSGKTTNLEFIYQSVPQTSRGKMVQMKTRTERTLFFDFLPVDLGQLGGFKTRFLLYTVPGQVYYNATRKLVLRGVDAVVFVADSGKGKMKENQESLQNLRDNLREYELDLDKLPWVIQYNKRDLPEVHTIEELEKELNPGGVPYFEAVAATGEGVFETFRGIGKVVLQKLSREVKLEERPARTIETATSAEPKAPAAAVESPVVGSPAAMSAPTPPPVETPVAATPSRPATPFPPRAEEPSPAPEPMPAEAEPVASMPTPGPAPTPIDRTPVAEERPAPRPVSSSREADGVARRLAEQVRPEWNTRPTPAPPPSSISRYAEAEEENSPGFLSRIFGRKGKKESEPEASETRVARIDLPPGGAPTIEGPVLIEKRVQIPITLSPQEVLRGATLRLVLELQVEAQSEEKHDAA